MLNLKALAAVLTVCCSAWLVSADFDALAYRAKRIVVLLAAAIAAARFSISRERASIRSADESHTSNLNTTLPGITL